MLHKGTSSPQDPRVATRLIRRSGGAVMLTSLLLSRGEAQGPSPEMIAFYREQMQALQIAMSDPTANQRAQGIWYRLVQHSHRMYPVVPSATFQMGQSLPNGVVLLDLALLAYPEEVTAFWMAHEYGHQVLGHPQLSASPLGRFMIAGGGTEQEDAADRWAGRFMHDAGYDIEAALAFLCRLPNGPPGDTHSKGPERAAMVARAYGHGGDACAGGDDVDLPDEETTTDLGGGAAYDACMAGMPARCRQVCMNSYGYPAATCVRMCQPDPVNMASWTQLCERESESEEPRVARTALGSGLRRIMTAAPSFRSIRGEFKDDLGGGTRTYTVTLGLEGFTSCTLFVESNEPNWVSCRSDDSRYDYDELRDAVQQALGKAPDDDDGTMASWDLDRVQVVVRSTDHGDLYLRVKATE